MNTGKRRTRALEHYRWLIEGHKRTCVLLTLDKPYNSREIKLRLQSTHLMCSLTQRSVIRILNQLEARGLVQQVSLIEPHMSKKQVRALGRARYYELTELGTKVRTLLETCWRPKQ